VTGKRHRPGNVMNGDTRTQTSGYGRSSLRRDEYRKEVQQPTLTDAKQLAARMAPLRPGLEWMAASGAVQRGRDVGNAAYLVNLIVINDAGRIDHPLDRDLASSADATTP
jgi:hypothetical protein